MQANVSILDDYSATQFTSRIKLPLVSVTKISESEDQAVCLAGKVAYESTIGPMLATGGVIESRDNWRHPTLASAFSFAQRSAITAGTATPVARLTGTSTVTEPFAQGLVDAALIPVLTIINVFGQVQSPALNAAISQIEGFRSRKDGWKGPNSVGPTEQTIDEAKKFVNVVLAGNEVEAPHIGLAADGEITFFWQNPKITIDLAIAGDGTYAYFAKPAAGRPFFEDASPVTVNLPEEILSLLRRAA